MDKSDCNNLPGQRRIRKLNLLRLALIPVTLILVIFLWDFLVRLSSIEPFILPSPRIVWDRFVIVFRDGSLFRHLKTTFIEIVTGMILGVILATITGYILAKSPTIERILSPYIVASQSVPVVAIAPLLIIWFGSAIYSKIIICALIVFFPVLVNTVVGLRTVPDDLRDLMRSLQANRYQTIRYLEIPAALPVFLGGLRIGGALSVIGAVVGELVGSDRGLGFMINRARGQYDTALVFVAVLMLVFVAGSLYGIVVLLEKKLLAWNEQPDKMIIEINK